MPVARSTIEWRNTILQPISKKTLIVKNTKDVETLRKLVTDPEFPGLAQAIRSISCPDFYQVSNTGTNGQRNEMLNLAAEELPNLTHLHLGLHTTGWTKYKWSAFQQFAIAKYDVQKSEQRIPLEVEEVMQFGNFHDVTKCQGLHYLRIDVYATALMRRRTVGFYPNEFLGDLKEHIHMAFKDRRVIIDIRIQTDEDENESED